MIKGLLLINLGSPDAPRTHEVRRYLREFLSDPRVIDLPAPIRTLLVYGSILPFRPHTSTKAYQAIWTEKGSPLVSNSLALVEKIKHRLGKSYRVALGMRYGYPSIDKALHDVLPCEELTILPLYPQFSGAATGSSLEKTLGLLAKEPMIPALHVIQDFFQHPSFIYAMTQQITAHLGKPEHILFSYHGLPERHLTTIGCKTICREHCPEITEKNRFCYKAQCYQTTEALAKALHLSKTNYSMSFQSRLGRTPWLKPYTDHILPQLAQQGIKHLAVVCPSFVTDCLETLEEIGIRAKEQWQSLGGEKLTLIPCLNDSDLWVEAILDICAITNLVT